MAKKKIRFNAVDVLIILFVAAAVAVFGYVFLSEKNVGSSSSSDKLRLQYVLKVNDLDDKFVGNVSKGDDLIEFDTNKSIGTVVAVSSAPAKRIGTNAATGAQVISEIEQKSDLFITVETEAQFTDDTYFVDGIAVTVGNVVVMTAPNLYAAANIVSVEPLE